MSCHKVSRALLDRFRFGELDAGCDEYLEHVERCGDCQREIALDRAMARDLRRALRERVDGFEPSPAVWRAVRLQAADPEPPGPWWATAVLSLTRAMRVMVPAVAIMLAAVLTWTGSNADGDANPATSQLMSRLQWREQLRATADVETYEAPIRIIPTPSIPVPVPSREMPYADPVAAIKQHTGLPSTGGMIR